MPKQSQRRCANGDGWVYQDGSQWRFKLAVRVDPVTGKVQYRGGRASSHAEATEKLRKLQAEFLAGRVAAPTKGTLGKFLDEWVENVIKPNRADATYRQYRWLIDLVRRCITAFHDHHSYCFSCCARVFDDDLIDGECAQRAGVVHWP